MAAEPVEFFLEIHLVGEQHEFLLEALLLLLERLYGKSASGEGRNFQKQTIDFLSKTGPLKKNALLILAATQPFREGERRMTLRVGELRERIDGYEDRISELKTKVDDLNNTVKSLQNMEKQLNDRLETRNLELTTERDRAHALEIHWREMGRSNLVGFAARTKATLLHEITEAILALDGQDPAVSMALDRLRRAKEHLENLENSVEGNR